MERLYALFFGILLVTVILLVNPYAYGQKLFLPKMAGNGSVTQEGNLLQVEGVNGRAIKINYTFNYHRQNMPRKGVDYYQPMHDEILYAASTQMMTINHDSYFIKMPNVSPIKAAGKSFTIPLSTLAADAPLRKAVEAFINASAQESGIIGQKHALSVKQIEAKVLEGYIAQIEKLSSVRR